jgi:hypothetical protein
MVLLVQVLFKALYIIITALFFTHAFFVVWRIKYWIVYKNQKKFERKI